jgi:hypothetical protein
MKMKTNISKRSLSVAFSILLFGAGAVLCGQDVTPPPAPPPPPEQQAVPTPLPPLPPEQTTLASTPVPQVPAVAPVATPRPDMSVSASRLRKKEPAASSTRKPAPSREKTTEKPEVKPEAAAAAAAAGAADTSANPPGPPASGATTSSATAAGAGAIEPLPPPDANEAVSPAAKVDAREPDKVGVGMILAGIFLGAAAFIVVWVTRRQRDSAPRIFDSSILSKRSVTASARRI